LGCAATLTLKEEFGMPDKAINLGARCEYLTTIEVHWPEVMKSLRLDTFPVYRTCLETTDPSTPLQTLAGLSEALERGASSQIKQVDLAVRKWAEVYDFRDAWLRDVALQTMHNWARGGTKSKWTYLPMELCGPKFQPDFGDWIPFYTKWPEFKRLTDKRYRRELAQYRAKVRTFWGDGQPKLSQSAVWTLQWQRGKSPEAIRTHHRRTTRKDVSLANIQLRVHAFAESAGLSLRASKAGRSAKI
jgi:hypothetical protein